MAGFFSKKQTRISLWLIILIALFLGFLDYPVIWNRSVDYLNQKLGLTLPHFFNLPFKLGLDLQGGTHLVYEADFTNFESADYDGAMAGVKEVIERRINLFGVAEPVVQINKSGGHYRLIVELAGVKDVHQAIKMIGQTPSLDFREKRDDSETENILADQKEALEKKKKGLPLSKDEEKILLVDPYFKPTKLTGRYLEKAELGFDSQTYKPLVNLQFNEEGAKIFEELTQKNVGKPLAIYLDGAPISTPVVREVISGGRAQITGKFSLAEAKQLATRLNAGALPVPIKLISQASVGASLGQDSLQKSLKAALYGLLAVCLFMILYYRLPGFLACLALFVYLVIVLAIFKLIPVTLTLAGIAGFLLSLGMAVDANVLIFERMKEELRQNRNLVGSIEEGFRRAWPAIRDGNISTLITCLILYIIATGMVKGFALTLGIGVLVSMFSAIIVTKSFLLWCVGKRTEKWKGVWG